MAANTKHHYLPQFYLRGFVADEADGNVWVYRAHDPKWTLRGISVTAQEPNYYSFVDETGRRNQSIENALQRIETDLAPAVRKLTETSQPLTSDDRMAVSRMVAYSMVRVPAYHEWAASAGETMTQELINTLYHQFQDDKNTFEAFQDVYRQTTGHALTLEQTQPERNKVPLPKSLMIQCALGLADHLASIICTMGWAIFHTNPGDYFITSDSPVFTNNGLTRRATAYGGLLQRGIEVTLPLTRNALLLAAWSADPVSGVLSVLSTREQLLNFNQRTARRAKHLLVSSTRNFPDEEQVVAGFSSSLKHSA